MAGDPQKLLAELMATFQAELEDHVWAMNEALLTLREKPDGAARSAAMRELFRHAHSLKGASRAVDLAAIEELAHGLESLLGAIEGEQASLEPETLQLLHQVVDALPDLLTARMEGRSPSADVEELRARMTALARELARAEETASGAAGEPGAAGAAAPLPPQLGASVTPATPLPPQRGASQTPATPPPPQPDAPEAVAPPAETIRVSVAKLDALLARAGELSVTRQRMDNLLADLEQLRKELEVAGLGEARRRLARLGHDLGNERSRMTSLVEGLQEEVQRVRMLPIATILQLIQRLVRDLAREQGKRVRLSVLGEETEVDKWILELVKDPLMHLVRNALDHGLETPAGRRRAGKPEEGVLALTAGHAGGRLRLEVSDDGRGIDPGAVRARAVEQGLLTHDEAGQLSTRETLDLVLHSGLSTASRVTEISGRGVGLDVVQGCVRQLNGSLELESREGRGTRVRLELPLSMATQEVLLVEASGEICALPIAAVQRLVPIQPADLRSLQGRPTLALNGSPVPLAGLAGLLGFSGNGPGHRDGGGLGVVVSQAGRRAVLVVDAVLGAERLVVKRLGPDFQGAKHTAAASILGSGRVVFILSPADLVEAALASPRAAPPAEEEPAAAAARGVPRILVVDDSITTRTLEKNLLEAAGYEVRVAVDGADALSVLNAEAVDLVVADILMPGMDGLELTRQLKSAERTRHLPVVLVTSLETVEDRRRGAEAGADAYIVKSRFDQDELLQTIERLI